MGKSPEDKRGPQPANDTGSTGADNVAVRRNCTGVVATSGNPRSDQFCSDMGLTTAVADLGDKNPYLSENNLSEAVGPSNGLASPEEHDAIFHLSTGQGTQSVAVLSCGLEPARNEKSGLVSGLSTERHFVYHISDNVEEIIENAAEVCPKEDGFDVDTYSNVGVAVGHVTELAPIEEYENWREQVLKQLKEANIGQDMHSSAEGKPAVKFLEQTVDINFFIPALRSPETVSDDGETESNQAVGYADEDYSGPAENYSTTDSSNLSMGLPRRPTRYNDAIDLRCLAVDDRLKSSAVDLSIVEEEAEMWHDGSTVEAEDNCTIFVESESISDEQAGGRESAAEGASINAFIHTEAEGSSDAAEDELIEEEDTELRDFVDQDCLDEDDDNAASAFAADIEERNDRSLSRLKKMFVNSEPANPGRQYTSEYVSAQPLPIVFDNVSGEGSDTESKDENIELDSMLFSKMPLSEPCQEAQSMGVSKSEEHIGPVDESRLFSNNVEALIKAEKKSDSKRLGFKEL